MTQSTNIKVRMHTVHKKYIVPFLGIGKCQHSAQIQPLTVIKTNMVFVPRPQRWFH